jgi:hypothetical protein
MKEQLFTLVYQFEARNNSLTLSYLKVTSLSYNIASMIAQIALERDITIGTIFDTDIATGVIL